MTSLKAFRGATQLSADSKVEMKEAVVELVKEVMAANSPVRRQPPPIPRLK